MSSFRSTRKIKEILMNPKASIVVDTDAIDRSNLGVIFEGSVELITDHQQARRIGMHIYTRYLGVDGANTAEPQSWLNDPEHLIIQLTPQKVIAWRG